jgi:cytochrome oxidase Cu insertion factor (SCO1/SenC/PrrC family)
LARRRAAFEDRCIADREYSDRLLALALLLLATGGSAACSNSAAGHGGGGGVRRDAVANDPIVFGELPELSLVGSDGAEVTREDLIGRPVALACIFTTCSGPCPAISAEMRKLQTELADTDAMLVSLTVDPDIDTPDVLAAYAESYGADPARWRFVTGDGDEIERVVRTSFYLALDRKTPGEDFPLGIHVTHSTELVVFDRGGRIRGYYSGKTREGLEALEARLRYLDREPVGRVAGRSDS